MGDAAHAMAFYLSMGISMAVEDAVALAECLSLLSSTRRSHSQDRNRHSDNGNHNTHTNDTTTPAPRTPTAIPGPRPTLHAALGIFESLRKPRAEAVSKASLHAGHILHLPPGHAQTRRDATMKADGAVQDGDGEYVYGIADRATRDWCYGYDAAEEVKREWRRVFGGVG